MIAMCSSCGREGKVYTDNSRANLRYSSPKGSTDYDPFGNLILQRDPDYHYSGQVCDACFRSAERRYLAS